MTAGQPPDHEVAIRAAPALAVLGALAAVVDLALNRVFVRAIAESAEPTVVLSWMRFGALPRNVAAICGLFALLASLYRYLRMPGFASLWVRLPVAAFSGILLPTLVLATVLPRERMAPQFVLFAMFATGFLVAFFALAALGYRERWLRLGLIAALLTAIQATVVIVIATVRAIMAGGVGGPIAWICRHGGELTWLLVPVLIAPAIAVKRPWDRRERVAMGIGIAMAALVVALGIAGEGELHPHYSTVMYGAFRVAALPEAASIVYVLPVAIGLGAGAWGLASADPWRRQIGAGLFFWIAGGYSPRSPIQLLDTVVGIILFARAAQAGDPEGVRRALLGWTTSAEPEPPPSRPSTPEVPEPPPEVPEPSEPAEPPQPRTPEVPELPPEVPEPRELPDDPTKPRTPEVPEPSPDEPRPEVSPPAEPPEVPPAADGR